MEVYIHNNKIFTVKYNKISKTTFFYCFNIHAKFNEI